MNWRGVKNGLKTVPAVRGAYRLLALALLRAKACGLSVSEAVQRPTQNGFPLPPPLLRYRVHGGLGKRGFLEVGRVVAQNITDILATVGKDPASFHAILDFGCGCGRVLRHFRPRPEACHLYGTDIDPEAIAWCSTHLSGTSASFDTNGFRPPTRYADDTFDFVYAISVFTHLDEQFQNAWLDELKRITKKGGLLLLTVHGKANQAELSGEQRNCLEQTGLLYRVASTGRLKPDGLPDFYQVTYHSKEYVHRHWTKYFGIVRYVEGGINLLQDAVLLRNE